MSESADRIETWRQVIAYLQSHPEDLALVMTMANLDTQPDAVTFESENARYAAQKGINNDFLGFGHYGHCGGCHVPVAVFPDRLVDWPLPEHRCPKGRQSNSPGSSEPAGVRQDRTGSGERLTERGVPAPTLSTPPQKSPRGLDI